MSIRHVQGDIFRTRMQTAAVGLNATGRLDYSPLATALQDRYPTFISDYRKQVMGGKMTPGGVWVWRESEPWLAGLIVRDTPHGSIRLRYVESALLNLYHDWERERLDSLALFLAVDDSERAALDDLFQRTLPAFGFTVVIYDAYQPGIDAEQDPTEAGYEPPEAAGED